MYRMVQNFPAAARFTGGIVWRGFIAWLATLAAGHSALALDFAYEVPLSRNASGTYYLQAEVGAERADFLLDTGAGMVTVNRDLFDRLRAAGTLQSVRRIAVRLANNDLRPVDVYEVAHFELAEGCELGPIEIAVLDRGGRNLLGLSALGRTGPFAVDTTASALLLHHCGD